MRRAAAKKNEIKIREPSAGAAGSSRRPRLIEPFAARNADMVFEHVLAGGLISTPCYICLCIYLTNNDGTRSANVRHYRTNAASKSRLSFSKYLQNYRCGQIDHQISRSRQRKVLSWFSQPPSCIVNYPCGWTCRYSCFQGYRVSTPEEMKLASLHCKPIFLSSQMAERACTVVGWNFLNFALLFLCVCVTVVVC